MAIHFDMLEWNDLQFTIVLGTNQVVMDNRDFDWIAIRN
jgi:hypothetical protein